MKYNSFQEYWPFFSRYDLFLDFLRREYDSFEQVAGSNIPVHEQFMEDIKIKISHAFRDFTSLLYDQLLNVDIEYIKPRLYLGWLQLKFLRNMLVEFEEDVDWDIQDSCRLSKEEFIWIGIHNEGLSPAEAERMAEIEFQKVDKKCFFFSRIAAPFLEFFIPLVRENYQVFNSQCRMIISDLDDKDLMGEEAIKRMATVLLSYSQEEVDTILSSAIDKSSEDLKNTNKNQIFTGEQAGILASFLRSTGLINIISNQEIGKHLQAITGINKDKIRVTIGKVDNKSERNEFLTQHKKEGKDKGEDKHDARQVIRYLRKVIKKIEDEIGD